MKAQHNFWQLKSLWKIMKNTSYFVLTNWIFYWKIRFSIYYEFSLHQISDIREIWKYCSLKDGFRSISHTFYGAASLWWVDQKASSLLDMINLWPNISLIKNYKCQQFFHLNFIFLKGCYFEMGSPIDMNVDMHWETSAGFLKSVVLQLFPKYCQSNVTWMSKVGQFNCL